MADSRDEWRLRDRILYPGRGGPRHGHRQRHARQLFRRRPLRRRPKPPSPTASNWPDKAPTFSTSAANRPVPAPYPVDLEEELRRVVPVVRELATRTDVPLSVDTYKAETARQALEAGAHVINDVTALHGDAEHGRSRANLRRRVWC